MTMKIDWMRGCATALVTPFRKDGSVDDAVFQKLVERQVKGGVKLLVPCGTTGESATMDEAATIDFTRKAREAGADCALVVAPYYNKPTQEGMFAHFSEVAKSVREMPIMLYNVPSRTSSNISAETTLRLAEKFDNIVATKEASGNFTQIMEIIRRRPKNFRVFSGDDMTTVPLISLGADGLVSVCANELPKQMSKMVEHALNGSFHFARKIHYKILPLMEANFIEASPAPCKFVMKELGLCDEHIRLPLVPVTKATQDKLRAIIKGMKL